MYKRAFAAILSVILCFSMTFPNAFALNFAAESVFVMDGDTGEELYSYNGDTARVPASMTKVLTAYIVYEELEKGTITLDTPVKISHNVAVKSRDSSYPTAVPLTEGATYSVDTLLHLIMIPSASASCIAMAEHISGSESAFVTRMNQTAKSLGLTATYYNCHGAQPNYITARSQAMLTKIFIDTYPDILRITKKSGFSFNGHYYNNTNHLLNTMAPYEGLDGFKTGTISAAGYCVTTTAVRNGRRVISVVMKSTSDAQRFADSRQLLDYGFGNFMSAPIQSPDSELGMLRVLRGVREQAELYTEPPETVVIPRAQEGKLAYEITLPESVTAPVEQNQTVGRVVVHIDSKEICSFPIKTREEVKKMTFLRALGKLGGSLVAMGAPCVE